MEAPNTREGIEEIVTKMLAIGWDSKMKKHDGTSIVVSFTKAELCELLLNLQEQHHQELQKAREEERERIRQEVNGMARAIKNDAHYMTELQVCEWLTKEVLSELDQPDALTK